jgi:hypothetical protein
MSKVYAFNKKNKLISLFSFLILTFVIFLPKGGIKIQDLPITWGYLFLGISSFLGIFFILIKKVRVSTIRLIVYCAILPFHLLLILYFLFNGYTDLNYLIALIISVIIIPTCFIVILGPIYDFYLSEEYIFNIIKKYIFLVSVYGIFLFIYKLVTDKFIVIPYITINASDYGDLEDKYINRGGVFKLISTFNNGNIYGVSLLMLLPLYCYLEKSKYKRLIVKFSLILTLSRTVWIGLILYELINIKISLKKFVFKMMSLLIIFGGVYFSLHLMSKDVTFFFDSDLGGRIDQFSVLNDIHMISTIQYEKIREIVYLSILKYFGIFGLLFFLIGFISPILFTLNKWHNQIRQAIIKGLFIYLVIAMSDGALIYIPVMAIYWMLVTVLISKKAYNGPGDKSG